MDVDTAADLGVASALISIAVVIGLTLTGLAARKSHLSPSSDPAHSTMLIHAHPSLQRRVRPGQAVNPPNALDTAEPAPAGRSPFLMKLARRQGCWRDRRRMGLM